MHLEPFRLFTHVMHSWYANAHVPVPLYLGREFGRVDGPVLSSSGGQDYIEPQMKGVAYFTGLVG